MRRLPGITQNDTSFTPHTQKVGQTTSDMTIVAQCSQAEIQTLHKGDPVQVDNNNNNINMFKTNGIYNKPSKSRTPKMVPIYLNRMYHILYVNLLYVITGRCPFTIVCLQKKTRLYN